MNSMGKNIFYNVIKSINAFIFPLISFSYVSHILYAEGMGKVEFARSYTAYFSLLAMLGIVNYSTREVAKRREDREEVSRFVHEIMILNVASVIISIIIFIISINTIKYLEEYHTLLIINIFSIPLNAMGLEWLYSAVEDYKYIAIRSCIVQFFSFACTLILVKTQEDYLIYAAINVLASCGTNIFNFLYSSKYVKYKWLGSYHFCNHIKSILLLFGMTVCVQIFTHLDSTMIGFCVGDQAVGLYSAATKISNVVINVIVAATAVFTPRIAFYCKLNRWEEIKKLSYKAFNYIFMLGIPGTLGLIILSKEIIEFFNGSSYLDAISTSKIVAFRVLLSPLNTFIMIHLFISIGKEMKNIITTVLAALGNILLNIALIPYLAQNGAAIATIIAEIIELIINLFFVHSVLDLKKIFKYLHQYCLSSGSIILIWALLRNCLNGLMLILAVVPISMVIYFGNLLFMKNPEVIEILNKVTRKFSSYFELL